ncbi:hypothetical protein H2201_007998 [Coniosporium apollinis]|uniref:DUF7726 domain-containing protein n=2 Tax=Coniosporium TaxID=2810619 RepID=A0ABQ9NHA1_9PEZI|nr:hypothetical protein H2199_005731 [Cladosporium sp. JES 115]KAJ9657889.1 hypothetical protein H2201_007998 [Coniosporium apollinis]
MARPSDVHTHDNKENTDTSKGTSNAANKHTNGGADSSNDSAAKNTTLSSILNPPTKRKSTDAAPTTVDPDNESDDLIGVPIDQNPDQIRRKIRTFIEAGGMKVGEFCDAIGVSNNSYNNFLKQSGRTKGLNSATFENAWAFFKKREMKGIKMPSKKKQKTEAAASAAKDGKDDSGVVDISGIELPGEKEDAVEVYDTCDTIRKKIDAHLRKPGVTQAQFCRDLLAQYHGPKKPAHITGSQLANFRGKKGPNAGNSTSVFYAAYVFFEKMRIKEGKKKTKEREEMEAIWGPKGGFEIEKNMSTARYIVSIGTEVYTNKYGEVHL